ncbi:MAG: hypothetical protein K6346_07570 [Halothiobacillaceae bacterium]
MRLRFLARVIRREQAHLCATDQRLFATPFTLEQAQQLHHDEALAERVDAFVSRFGRLQDTVGDKLLPAWISAVGERPSALIDNLDRAERLGLLACADTWIALRQLRNQMVHEYIEDLTILVNALQTAHDRLPLLIDTANALLADLQRRGFIDQEDGA